MLTPEQAKEMEPKIRRFNQALVSRGINKQMQITSDGRLIMIAPNEIEALPDGIFSLTWELFHLWSDLERVDRRACECGSEKAGIPGHSSWCPKHI